MKYHTDIKTGASTVVLLTAAIACSSSFIACNEEEHNAGSMSPSGDMRINFTLNVGDNSPVADLTRATPPGDYDRGQGYENYIDILGHDFHFYFFSTENVFMGELAISGIEALETPSSSSKQYNVVGVVKGADLGSSSFKIVAVANWRHRYPDLSAGQSTIDDLCAAVYDFSTPFMPAASTPIPLFGVKSYSSMEFDSNNYADGGTLHLLRAMAKVEVICESERWSLEEATMTRYNKAGHSAPKGVYDQSDYVHNSWPDDYVNHASIPEATAQGTGLGFTETPLPSGKSVFTVYVPEFRNTDATGAQLGERAQIDIKFHESPQHYTLEFDTYENGVATGKPFDINRNCYYRYTVTKKDEWSDIEVALDVEPYSEVALIPDFGLDRDEKGRIIFFRDGDTVYLLDTDSGRCFTENAAGETTYVTSIYDRTIGQYIYQYIDGYGYFWHRAAKRWYIRSQNGEIFYVSFSFNGLPYYYDPVRRQCYSFENGVREYVTQIIDNSLGIVVYQYHEGISYFYDPVSKEYYYRTSYGDRVDISMTINGVHYLYDLSKKMFYIEGTTTYVSEITDHETGKVVYKHHADIGKSFFLDTKTDEYYYRNPLGDKVFVTMTVGDTKYYFSLSEQRYYHYTPDKTFVDIITDTDLGRIVYRYVNGIAYFWDSRIMKYYYRDPEGIPTYVDNLPNN